MKKLFLVVLTLTMLSLNACSSSSSTDPSIESTPEMTETMDYNDETEVMTNSKTYNFTVNLYSKDKFFIEQEYVNDSMTTKMYVDGDKLSIITENEDSSSIMIMDEEFMYMLMPEEMTAMMWPIDPEMEDEDEEEYGITEDDPEIYNTYLNTGSEMIDGKSYEYEEYSVDGQGIKYYFENDTLKYMRTFSIEDDMEYLIKIIDYGTDFSDSVFDVPEGYTIIDASSMGYDME